MDSPSQARRTDERRKDARGIQSPCTDDHEMGRVAAGLVDQPFPNGEQQAKVLAGLDRGDNHEVVYAA